MTTPAIGTTPAPSTQKSASDAARTSLSQNFDSFLKLLTTQLQNQDPLSPMDSTQFIQQLAEFSQVEQQIDSNKNLEQLIALQDAGQTSAGLGFIGKTVEANGDTAMLKDGQAKFAYTLDGQATLGTIDIMDAAGNVVFSTPAQLEPGKHAFTWDGKDRNGNPMTDGAYSIAVAAKDANGKAVNISTTAFGQVTGLESDDSGLKLDFGDGISVPVTQVISVSVPTAPAA